MKRRKRRRRKRSAQDFPLPGSLGPSYAALIAGLTIMSSISLGYFLLTNGKLSATRKSYLFIPSFNLQFPT